MLDFGHYRLAPELLREPLRSLRGADLILTFSIRVQLAMFPAPKSRALASPQILDKDAL